MDTAALNRSISIKLWPPSQSTRLLLVERMTKNLATPSILSRKYGLLSKEEAEKESSKLMVMFVPVLGWGLIVPVLGWSLIVFVP